jgi:Fe-S-cluster containining protein
MELTNYTSPGSKEAQASLYACYFSLEAALLTETFSESYFKALASFFAAYDTYISIVVSEINPTCKAQCSACCYDNPHGISGVELLYIYDLIKDDKRFEQWKNDFAAKHTEFHQLRKNKGPKRLQTNWKKSKYTCVFLNEKKQCSIYERRPVACRMFFSLTSPGWCSPDHHKYDDAINPHLEPSSAIKDLLKKLSADANVAEIPKDLISGMYILFKRMGKNNLNKDV